jgi:thiamine biosynthesis lipoprotein
MIRQTWLQMGMPITVCIQDDHGGPADIAAVYALFDAIDRRFSPYRADSEVSRLNAGVLCRDEVSAELASILARCAQTKAETGGYFDPERDGRLDPSGLVKGWAIERASDLLASRGLGNYVVDAGGDVRAVGRNGAGQPWRVGIRNPFNRDEIIKVLEVEDGGVATSGTAVRGSHIYNPWQPGPLAGDIVSLTVVGPTIYDADRFATAAFAMGRGSVAFIAERPGLDAYAVTADRRAFHTEGFARYVR